jgi:molybdopterin-guanine dinucleotide biosynthesis protein A
VKEKITGIILAGGQARRMGGDDKGLITINDRPLIEYVIEGFGPQVDSLIINANRNLDTYKSYGYPVIPDSLSGYEGPLAGIAAGMKNVRTEYIVTVPCDSPFIDEDYVSKLSSQVNGANADIYVAHDGKRIQPVFCLLRTNLLKSLEDYLSRGERKIDRWYEEHNLVSIQFDDSNNTFMNINTPDDIRIAEAILGTMDNE